MNSPANPDTRTLSEFESKQRLAQGGVPMGSEKLVDNSTEAVIAAEEFGFPVVAKLCGDAIAHKTERGLVRLNLRDAASVAEATEALLASAQPEDAARGVLIAPMVGGTRELIAGTLVDPTFGKCVMLGIGGIFAEALADVTFRLIPLSRQDAEDMIANLEHQSWFREFRGEPEVNRDELVAILLGLSRIAQNSEEIVSIDINPLIISEGSPIAVDALVEVKS
ncbi:MAG: acetate--CoA ligase family protein [Candidatus Binatia bacterium]|nr:acetate--CoA ligase family protein [Candidatus Binatia bacterium]MDG2009128.1 acetate--CoA ligase family protein [Candidatus Binatia bacterium]